MDAVMPATGVAMAGTIRRRDGERRARRLAIGAFCAPASGRRAPQWLVIRVRALRFPCSLRISSASMALTSMVEPPTCRSVRAFLRIAACLAHACCSSEIIVSSSSILCRSTDYGSRDGFVLLPVHVSILHAIVARPASYLSGERLTEREQVACPAGVGVDGWLGPAHSASNPVQ